VPLDPESPIPPPEQWEKIWATNHNLYALSDGVLYGFGSGQSGQFGSGSTGDRQFLSILTGGQSGVGRGPWYGPGIRVVDMWGESSTYQSSSDIGSLFVQIDNNGALELWSCGSNQFGKLGNGNSNNVDVLSPYLITQLAGKRVVSTWITDAHSMLVTSTGEVWGAGAGDQGTLGTGSSTLNQSTFARAKLTATDFVTNAVEVMIMLESNYGSTSYLRLSTGQVLASGLGANARLGDGDLTDHRVFFFNTVKTAANTPLTNIVKMQVTNSAAAFLNTTGSVYWTSYNVDNIWGNGEALNRTNLWATAKQFDVVDFWAPASPRYYLAAFYLKSDLTLWACGINTDFQLGVVESVEGARVPVIERVALPRDQYPVALRRAGTVSSVDNLPVVGTIMVTQKGEVFFVGNVLDSSPDTLNGSPRFPKRLLDNIINEQSRTL
jgi:hypothetical protein